MCFFSLDLASFNALTEFILYFFGWRETSRSHACATLLVNTADATCRPASGGHFLLCAGNLYIESNTSSGTLYEIMDFILKDEVFGQLNIGTAFLLSAKISSHDPNKTTLQFTFWFVNHPFKNYVLCDRNFGRLSFHFMLSFWGLFAAPFSPAATVLYPVNCCD